MIVRSLHCCPKCDEPLKRIRPSVSLESFFGAIAGDIGFQLAWILLGGAIAAVTYRLFGEVAAFVILFAAAVGIDRAVARFRCTKCGHEMRRDERARCRSIGERSSA